ncbi:MAG: LssY C-terminal domain-containing protein [Acidobacteriaceae bacterium]|nr:LssY C-terminal domain-containing protein [Acidobacteriaceae bacterium]
MKLVIARSPDSEIYLPSGTELLVQLESSLSMDLPPSIGQTAPPLSEDDEHRVEQLLATGPVQQTMSGRNQASDLVNILLLGTPKQVDAAFHDADWTGENRRGVLALFRMYHGLVQRMGYSHLPMAPLTLNGVRATRTYQKSLNTIAKRHHVRLWNQLDSDTWLGAATEDIGYTIRDMHVTHEIDLSIDNERAKVVNDLWFSGCVQAASLFPRLSLKVVDDGVSPLMTDGDIAVLRLKTCDGAPPAAQRPKRLTRAAEAFEAVGLDMARANPLTVGLLVTRSVAMHCRRSDRTAASVATAPSWQRPNAIGVAALFSVQQPGPSLRANNLSQSIRRNVTLPSSQ